MKKLLTIVFFVLLVGSLSLFSFQDIYAIEINERSDEDVILKFFGGVSKSEIEALLRKYNLIATDEGMLSQIGYIKVKIPVKTP